MEIRNEIKLSKDFYNPAGGFLFRNAEVMLSTIKPLCKEKNITFYFEDDVVNVGKYNYIKSKIIITDVEDGENFTTSAMAREDDYVNHMAFPMLSGAASSYCHKYLLQNAFAIDDGSMDPDSFGSKPPKKVTQETPAIPETNEQPCPVEPCQNASPVQSTVPQMQASVPEPVAADPGFAQPELPFGEQEYVPNYMQEWDNMRPVMPNIPNNPMPDFSNVETVIPDMSMPMPAPEATNVPPVNKNNINVHRVTFNFQTHLLDVQTNQGCFQRDPYKHMWVNVPRNIDPDDLYIAASDCAHCDLDRYNGSFI